MQVGDVISWERTFTAEDIQLFGEVSGDQGVHHVSPDEQGRLMVQGLLTATLPTKLGGDLNFIARLLTFEFHRPVFAGDTVCCELTIATLEPAGLQTPLSATFKCTNQLGKTVMTGLARGVIRNR